MISLIKKTFLLLIILNCISCGTRPNKPNLPKVVAIVGEEEIKQDELGFWIRLKSKNLPNDFIKEESLYLTEKTNILNELIERKIVNRSGKINGVELTPDEITIGLEKLKYGYSKKEFEIMLNEQKIPLHKWQEMALSKTYWQKTIEETIYPKLEITKKEMKDYYQENIDQYQNPEQVRVRHIVTDSFKKAQKIRQKILDGENFAKLAIMHSLSPDRSGGGDLGYFAKGTHPVEFDKTCFELKKGEVSEIIKSPYGFHIFKLIHKRKAFTTSFKEARDEIKNFLMVQKFNGEYKIWLDELKTKTPIKIFTENLENSVWF
jgi:hypothetical protein